MVSDRDYRPMQVGLTVERISKGWNVKMHYVPEDEHERNALKEMFNSSDHATALLAGAFLDNLLKDLFKHKMRKEENSKTKKIFESIFHASGALGSLRTKINLGYLHDFYGELLHNDLNYIAVIRNDFAHKLERLHFNDIHCKDLLTNLKIVDFVHKPPTGIRDTAKNREEVVSLVNDFSAHVGNTAEERAEFYHQQTTDPRGRFISSFFLCARELKGLTATYMSVTHGKFINHNYKLPK
ncbi:hypothetical protein FMN63_25105 [Stappia sp. BW2]|uniref:hypothetical protein n=1 Tax=Stappia sp. BW2 TaxID=2592622 RepID=UPI0011DE9EEA|nr:hypothetical protein [Stappia sp. BW2]TYC65664.1 hypothetical protein FMN63_25105 [Stappia sp. BW2]